MKPKLALLNSNKVKEYKLFTFFFKYMCLQPINTQQLYHHQSCSFFEVCIPVFSDLQVGQIAFRNTKSLNQIQSVVFDTAYTTNESLLICAPTVAGKTIIAMLTILHTVRQHIENGVIHRDKFKVNRLGQMFS